jgi:hypothetical protein
MIEIRETEEYKQLSWEERNKISEGCAVLKLLRDYSFEAMFNNLSLKYEI